MTSGRAASNSLGAKALVALLDPFVKHEQWIVYAKELSAQIDPAKIVPHAALIRTLRAEQPNLSFKQNTCRDALLHIHDKRKDHANWSVSDDKVKMGAKFV